MGPRNVVKHESARDSMRRLGLAAQDQKSTALRPSARHWRRRAWYRYGALFYRFSASGRTLALRRRGDWKNAALRGHHTALAHLHGATVLTFSPRTSEKSCPLCPCATRANCLVCSQRTSETFCPRFSWAGSEILPTILRQREKIRTVCTRVARGLPIFRGQNYSHDISGG